jgi:hypothetical protein
MPGDEKSEFKPVLATKSHEMTQKRSQTVWVPIPQSDPNGFYCVMSCLFVAKKIREVFTRIPKE